MGYYDALIAKWPSVVGNTIADRLAVLDVLTAPGPNIDVRPSQVIGYLMLNLKWATLAKYAAAAPATTAGAAAAELVAIANMGSNAPLFFTSDPTAFASLSAMLNALASDPQTGITSADVAALLALAQTTIPWWQANGYTSPIHYEDLASAGLAPLTPAAGVT